MSGLLKLKEDLKLQMRQHKGMVSSILERYYNLRNDSHGNIATLRYIVVQIAGHNNLNTEEVLDCPFEFEFCNTVCKMVVATNYFWIKQNKYPTPCINNYIQCSKELFSGIYIVYLICNNILFLANNLLIIDLFMLSGRNYHFMIIYQTV